MAKSLTKIMADWTWCNNQYGLKEDKDKGKKVDASQEAKKEKVLKGQDKIRKGFKRLKTRLQKAATDPTRADTFEKTRQSMVVVMGVFCKKTLGGSALPFLKNRLKYKAKVIRLLESVAALSLKTVDPRDLLEAGQETEDADQAETQEAEEEEGEDQELSDEEADQLLDKFQLPDNADAINFDSDEDETAKDQAPPVPPPLPPTPPQPVQANSLVWTQRLAAVSPKLKAALAANKGDVAQFTRLFTDANNLAKAKNYPDAVALLNKLEPLLTATGTTTPVRWEIARKGAIAQVRQLQTALTQSKDPRAIEIVKQLEAIPKELEGKVDSLASITALETYVNSNDVIQKAEMPNPWKLQIDIRDPLLKALAEAKAAVSA